MERSPPATRANTDRMEAKLKDQVKVYRKQLQKISRLKTKILGALRDENCAEAAELLQTPTRDPNAPRCGRCIGCLTLEREGPCQECQPCRSIGGCSEHTRLCMTWPQPMATFIAGSVSTGVSSLCDIIDYDLAKYKDYLDKLGDASLEVEAVLDEFPVGSEKHLNDRFNATRRTKDIQVEEDQFGVIEMLLNRYQDHRARLRDVFDDDEEIPDDAVDVAQADVSPWGLLTQTNTLHQFGLPPHPGQPVDDGTQAAASIPEGEDMLGLGRGFGWEDGFQSLGGLSRSPGRTQEGAAVPVSSQELSGSGSSGATISSEARVTEVPTPPPVDPDSNPSGIASQEASRPGVDSCLHERRKKRTDYCLVSRQYIRSNYNHYQLQDYAYGSSSRHSSLGRELLST